MIRFLKYWAELVEEAEESGCPSIINNKDQTLENRELDRPDNHKVTIQDKNCWLSNTHLDTEVCDVLLFPYPK